ncbi:MAG: hypothetical protein JWP47_85 [Polaromonas sp.]|nr:hypothetical protein [Polaromonas sp.]
MNDEQPLPPDAYGLPALHDGRFSGPREFAGLVRLAFATAAERGWRELILSDGNFEAWPLGERAVAESLHEWSRAGRKFTMLAKSYDEVVRRHARFVSWRRTWSRIVECRSLALVSPGDFPSAFWSPDWVFQRLDTARSTGFAGSEAIRRTALKEQLDECLGKSASAFPATTLGL